MSDYITKNIERYLVLDWTDDSIRVLKNRPEMNPGEIPIKVNLKVKVPKNKIPEINEEVELDQTRMEDLETEEIPYEEMKKEEKDTIGEHIKDILGEKDTILLEQLRIKLKERKPDYDRETLTDILVEYEREGVIETRKGDHNSTIIESNIASVDELLKEDK